MLVGWHHPVSDGFTAQGQDPGTCQGPNGEECRPNPGGGTLPIVVIVVLIGAILSTLGGIF